MNSGGKKVLGLALFAIATLAVQAASERFDFDVLSQTAKALAAKPYAARVSRVPESLKKLTYDEHRRIQFIPERSLWLAERLPFRLQFFHPGFQLSRTVQINEVIDGRSSPVPFDSRAFRYDGLNVGTIPPDMGFAGFRILCQLNQPNDELGAFAGASYFRLLCEKAAYGLSARGLAVDTAEPTGEEFPIFEEFWVERPKGGAKQLVIYALLDSPSMAGAYRFAIEPGAETISQVKAAVYCRKNPKVFGIAPLTSMFWYGENSEKQHEDFRPEVHDSDGLMLATGNNEWIWRPLDNPKVVRTAAFSAENPKGFGLLQRDRQFGSYEDLEARYNLRPSAWVEPVGAWGKGEIRLVEIPTPDETNDNIVAFWVPEKLPAPGQPIEFEYKLHWFLDQIRPPTGYAVATRVGRSLTHEPELRRFVVDFDGASLRALKSADGVEPVVSVGAGATLANATVQANSFNGTWRIAFAIKPDGSGKPVELRCFLRQAPHVLTETWSYLWTP
jgi:glucans biosynthesis protein